MQRGKSAQSTTRVLMVQEGPSKGMPTASITGEKRVCTGTSVSAAVARAWLRSKG
jgi:hypothetical protein